jgi:GT2 family glycosyltransferase/glycosyltransferase involved in cell wall biosynthesis
MVSRTRSGVVSVVLVNYKGADDTIACLQAFADVDWPAERLELVVVDNASGDGSAERIRAAVPDAKLVESPVNGGFTAGCNLGVAESTGEFIGFINNDARPGPQWIRGALDMFTTDPKIACVASKVLDWDGKLVDYVDGSMTFYGMGYKREVEKPDSPDYDHPKDVLFATGAAMFVRADVYREVGGFDERFFMFYEDVDFGWRLNLLGHKVRYAPASVAYHRHHVTMNKFGSFREIFLLERNALMTIFKNYEDATLAKALPAALALAVRRNVARGGDDASIVDLQRSPGGDDEATATVTKTTLAGPYAVDSFLDHLPSLTETRKELQAQRRRSDLDLMPLFRQALEPAVAEPAYLEAYEAVVKAFDIEHLFSNRRRIVIATHEPLTAKMAGPAIRAWEIAKALSAEHDVELVTLARCTVSHPAFAVRNVGGLELRRLEQWCDVFLFQGFVMQSFPWLKSSKKVLVIDVYDPIHLEQLEQGKDLGETGRAKTVRDVTHALNEQLGRGDFFMCASEKQRDFWLGQLAALGRLNPETYDSDETMSSLIAAVPFGVSDTPPRHDKQVIKGVIDGIGENDKVILWGGGIYNWFDPLTLIRAVDRLRTRRPDAKLFFLGLKHPNPDVPDMRMAVAARDLSDSLGLTDKHVFFNEGWIAYEERQNYLMEADIGVSTHLDHVETAFSFRTRILDYLWASLPIVATGGDTFDPIINGKGLGITVPPGDEEALEAALFRLLDDEAFAAQCRANVAAVAGEFAWSRVLEPLVQFCRSPRRAPDLVDLYGEALPQARPFMAPRRRWRDDVGLAREYLKAGGAREVSRRAYGRVRRTVRTRLGLSAR